MCSSSVFTVYSEEEHNEISVFVLKTPRVAVFEVKSGFAPRSVPPPSAPGGLGVASPSLSYARRKKKAEERDMALTFLSRYVI